MSERDSDAYLGYIQGHKPCKWKPTKQWIGKEGHECKEYKTLPVVCMTTKSLFCCHPSPCAVEQEVFNNNLLSYCLGLSKAGWEIRNKGRLHFKTYPGVKLNKSTLVRVRVNFSEVKICWGMKKKKVHNHIKWRHDCYDITELSIALNPLFSASLNSVLVSPPSLLNYSSGDAFESDSSCIAPGPHFENRRACQCHALPSSITLPGPHSPCPSVDNPTTSHFWNKTPGPIFFGVSSPVS